MSATRRDPKGKNFRWIRPHERDALRDLFQRYSFIFWRRQVASFDSKSLSQIPRSLATRLSPAPVDYPPDISFVIPVHNQIRFTLACLDSIAEQRTTYSYEIIVGDDASTDGTDAALKMMPAVRRISHVHRLGFAANCNISAQHARGRYIAIMNNDVVLFPDWLETVLETFKSAGDIGLLGGMLLFPDGRLQEVGCTIADTGITSHIGSGDDPAKQRYEGIHDVAYCSGAAIVLPATSWTRLNGFDPEFLPAYYEDVDLAFRTRGNGQRVLCQPAAKAIHFVSQTYKNSENAETLRILAVNRQKFLNRWATHLVATIPTFLCAMVQQF